MIDKNRIDRCQAVSVSETEGKRLQTLGVEIPAVHVSGPIKYQGKVVGHADFFSGICFTDKDFSKTLIQDIQWYINETVPKCGECRR